ncbi:MAG: methyltransferase domain-containing protein [Gemmatimonadetes bacterium]|jgi:ubiquinone/menaquinone biosynthesis C-methylase UbiE|nr:methyltransferase domain-containing protein [Gemmatimonadota bacterium]MBT6147466.1 methyltransferase domain-containing protein [Gemmatimonadota bacterium]MBT7858681.1 methyltransferase domain-containing protein [Gemmatimonadota bacterium]
MDEERYEALRTMIRTSYEDAQIVTRYVRIGLWPSEEALIAEHVPDGARVLDLGCGAGRVAIPLAEMGLDVVGIDVSAGMVAAAREQARYAGDVAGQLSFDVGDATTLGFPNESFDSVLFCYNGIELVPGLQGKRAVVEEAYRVLRPGGRFIVCVHSLFAFNIHVPMRLRAFLRFLGRTVLGLPVREQELGERFLDDDIEEAPYLQVWPPARWRGLFLQAGFELVTFNSRQRLERGRPWSRRGTFEDGERFFVVEKPTPSVRPITE